MIEAEFFSSGSRLLGFCLQGHSGFAGEGFDIICASVSSAAYMTVNTITDVIGLNPQILRVDEALMELRLAAEDAAGAEQILSGFRLHMLQLEEQYPKYVTLKISEV